MLSLALAQAPVQSWIYIMIHLSQKVAEEFRKIWKEEYGEELTLEEADSKGGFFLDGMRTIYKLAVQSLAKNPEPPTKD